MARSGRTPQTWIEAGLKALARSGPSGARAETLARDVGATKGSFYWHFKDVPAFHAALLSDWQKDIQSRFEFAISQGDTAVTKLRALSAFRLTDRDHAIRSWAHQYEPARHAVDESDKAIVARISALLKELGATHPDFPGLIHAAAVACPEGGDHLETLIDLLLVLK